MYLITSMSKGPLAIEFTRRVLDQYGHRYGHDVWMVRTTIEGIRTIIDALEQLPPYRTYIGMAISFHKISGFKNKKLSWIGVVGDHSPFNNEGAVYTSFSKRAVGPTNLNEHQKTVINVSHRAGLKHDPGKNTVHFGNKLRKNRPISDFVRHEVFSSIFTQEYMSDGDLKGSFERAIATGVELTSDSTLIKSHLEIEKWMVLSHHRLLAAGFRANNHVSENSDLKSEQHEDILKNHGVEIFREIEHALNDSIALTGEAPARAIALFSRLSLMLSDHYVSSLSRTDSAEILDSYGPCPKYLRTIFERTIDQKQKANSWQPLGGHIQAVGATSKLLSKTLMSGQFTATLPRLGLSSLANIAGAEGRFKWQSDLVAEIDTLVKNRGGYHGMLIFAQGSTGSGKTRTCAAAANALSGGEARFTTALNLRSLTLQTGDEYREDLGLSKSDVSVLIGSKQVRAIHDMNRAHDDEDVDEDDHGSEEYLLSGGSNHRVSRYLKTQLKCDESYLTTPVLVTTIDNIIGAGSQDRSKWIKPFLRLMSGPLILDEIDQYDTSDLIPVARLVFIAGLSGIPVILSSATIYPAVALNLQKAYSKGYEEYRLLFGKENDQVSIFSSDTVSPLVSSSSEFVVRQEQFSKDIINSYQGSKKTKISVITETPVDTESVYEIATDSSNKLHREHSWTTKYGNRLSVGLVRFANIKDVNAFSENLSKKESSNLDVAIIPYHSRYPLGMRTEIEINLDLILKRKKENRSAPENHKKIDERLFEAKKNGRDLMVVVVASPVEEVGRDHDFDWAVIEPSSTRSIIQCCGRVNRHRRDEVDTPNIHVIGLPTRHFGNNKSGTYTRPGFESSWNRITNTSIDMKSIAPWIDGWAVNAAPCLFPKDYSIENFDSLPVFENNQIDRSLQDNLQKEFIKDVSAFFNDKHYKKYIFRKSAKMIDYYIDKQSSIRTVEDNVITKKSLDIPDIGDANLLDMDPQIIALNLSKKLGRNYDDQFMIEYMSYRGYPN